MISRINTASINLGFLPLVSAVATVIVCSQMTLCVGTAALSCLLASRCTVKPCTLIRSHSCVQLRSRLSVTNA